MKWIITAIDSTNIDNIHQEAIVSKYNEKIKSEIETTNDVRVTTITYSTRINLIYDLKIDDVPELEEDELPSSKSKMCILDLFGELFTAILKDELLKEIKEVECIIYTNPELGNIKHYSFKIIKDLYEVVCNNCKIKIIIDNLSSLNTLDGKEKLGEIIDYVNKPNYNKKSSRSSDNKMFNQIKNKKNGLNLFSIRVRRHSSTESCNNLS